MKRRKFLITTAGVLGSAGLGLGQGQNPAAPPRDSHRARAPDVAVLQAAAEAGRLTFLRRSSRASR